MLENCCPYVAAFNLETGRRMLQSCGYTIGVVLLTGPPGKNSGVGDLRIVRQKLSGNRTVELTVSYESYMKEVI